MCAQAHAIENSCSQIPIVSHQAVGMSSRQEGLIKNPVVCGYRDCREATLHIYVGAPLTSRVLGALSMATGWVEVEHCALDGIRYT